MNERAVEGFSAEGGLKLLGTNVFDCHPEPSRTKLKTMLAEQSSNIYSIEKQGVKKLIVQTPWYDAGKYAGLMELSIIVPWEMPHFVRDKATTE